MAVNKKIQSEVMKIEQYPIAVHSGAIGLWKWEVVSDRIFFSPNLNELIGYQSEDLPTTLTGFAKLFFPEIEKNIVEQLKAQVKNNSPHNITVQLCLNKKSGKHCWLEMRGESYADSSTNAIIAVGTLIDITEHKKSEQRLTAQYAAAQVLSEATDLKDAAVKLLCAICEPLQWQFGSFWMMDNETELLYSFAIWHSATIDAIEFSEVTKTMKFPMGIGLPGRVWETGHPTWINDVVIDPNYPRAPYARMCNLHSAFGFPILLGNKVLGMLEFYTTIIQSPDEPLLKMMGALGPQIGQFIQRKITESKLQESEMYKSAILESVSDCIVTIDSLGTILSYNPQTKKIFKCISVDLNKANISKFIPSLLEKIDLNLDSPVIELTAVRNEKDSFPAELTISKMHLDKKVVFVLVIRDITERKKIEQLKNEFISVVSHELRTPLTSIRGSIGLILGGAVGKFTDKTKELLTIANNNCDRLLFLINDILDIEKMEANKVVFDIKPVLIEHLVKEAIVANKMYCEKFKVKVNLTETLSDIKVNVDSIRLIQVLTNLISNAVKFSEEGSEVLLKITRDNNKVRVSVIDKGVGIPLDFQSHIFQKFAQADSSIVRAKGGTGLGLSICKEIIERFSGKIEFISVPNKGTTFYFELPIWNENDAIEIELQEKQTLEKDMQDVKLLICEDDEYQASYLEALLETAGYTCDIAHTVAKAKSFLQDKKYHAILLDLILPDQDGISFIRELRNMSKTATLPIIVTSIMTKTGKSMIDGDVVNVVDWLDKPVDFKKLINSIQKIKKKFPNKKPFILHIEDDVDTQESIKYILTDYADVISANSLNEGKEKLNNEKIDLVILDLLLPDGNGIDLLPMLAQFELPVVVFSSIELDKEYAKYVHESLIKSESSFNKIVSSINRALDGKLYDKKT